MNPGNHSSGTPGKSRRRRRRHSGSQPAGQNQPGQTQQGRGQGHAGQGHAGQGQAGQGHAGQGQARQHQQRQARHERQNNPGGIYTAPMDHSYRDVIGNGNGRSTVPGAYPVLIPEIVPGAREGANSRIFAFVEDLFFMAKIQETARKLGVKVEFVKTEKELLDRIKENGEEKPSLIIFDLNNANAKPLTIIPKLKSKLKKGTSFLGFLSHIQGELKMKAQEAGCDMVVPRSAFSQNLPQILRRHGAKEEDANEEEETQTIQ
jgi:hypothetical protein